MLHQDASGDYVIATGKTHSIRELLDVARGRAGVVDWGQYLGMDTRLLRPAEVDPLTGEASNAAGALGWRPQVNFRELIEMVDSDIKAATTAASHR